MIRAAPLLAALALAGCGGSEAKITAGPHKALADVPPQIRVTGAPPNATVKATATDARGLRFTSSTKLADLKRDAALPLVNLARGDDFFVPPLRGFEVQLAVVDDGDTVGRASIEREVLRPGVKFTKLRDDLYGDLFEPSGGEKRPGVLVIGGSEGGLGGDTISALLAAHGATALALAYFKEPGLPQELRDIPLEYFQTALERLRSAPNVDPERVFVLGASRGGEGALLVGATYPRLVHGVIALVPSNVVNSALDGHSPAWTVHGKPVPYTEVFGDPTAIDEPRALIRAERITGPILTVAGERDALWPSPLYTKALHERLDKRHLRFPHRNLLVPGAGHLVGGGVPYFPIRPNAETGGSPQADDAGKAKVWPQIVRLITGP